MRLAILLLVALCSFGAEASSPTHLVVLFRPDVERAAADRILLDLHVKQLERPDLLVNQYLIETTLENALVLADREEVAHLYPASEDLVAGIPVHGCQGPLSDDGQIAQYVSSFGQGWDGAGRGPAALTYTISQSGSLDRHSLANMVAQALAAWAKHARITFSPSSTPGPRNLSFVIARGAHGDGYQFDGRGRVLGHTFYPDDVSPEPFAGDIHLDDDEPWSTKMDPDLYSVILHEVGHALGLGHSDRPGAVMYPYYRRLSELQLDDVSALQRLYAAPESEPVAIPSSTPQTTAPAQQPTPSATSNDRTAPSLAITFPATSIYATSSDVARLAGNTRDSSGISEITWVSSGGSSGSARGTSQWTVDSVPLLIGDNRITIYSRDTAGNIAKRTVTVTRR